MRFVCQHCEAKYTIADDKVRNKVLKIRCRKCGEIIEVRDPDLVTKAVPSRPAPDRVPPPKKQGSVLEGKFADSFRGKTTASAKGGTPGLFDAVKRSAQAIGKSETDLVHWFVAIDGTPVGPISARKVHVHRQGGRVSDDTLMWKEGMPDWLPLRNCKEMIGLLARIDIEDMAEVGRDQEGPKRGLFANEAEGASEQPSPLKGHTVGVIGERRDSDVDAEIEAAFGLAPAPAADEEPTQAVKAATIFDVVDKMSGRERTKQRQDDTLTNYRSEVSELHSLSPPRPAGQNRLVLFMSVGLFVVALTVLFFVLFMGETAETKTVQEVVEKVVYRDRVIEKPVYRLAERAADDKGDEADQKGGRGSGSQKSRGVGKTAAGEDDKKVDEKTRRLMEQLGSGGMTERGPLGGVPSGKTTRGGSGGAAASALSANQVKSVVTKNKNGLKTCYERSLKLGQVPTDRDIRVNFNVVVGASGTVTSVNLSGEGAKYSALDSCLSRNVKKWVFPASSSSSPVEFPFVFSPR